MFEPVPFGGTEGSWNSCESLSIVDLQRWPFVQMQESEEVTPSTYCRRRRK
jgi:hypothetical protein